MKGSLAFLLTTHPLTTQELLQAMISPLPLHYFSGPPTAERIQECTTIDQDALATCETDLGICLRKKYPDTIVLISFHDNEKKIKAGSIKTSD